MPLKLQRAIAASIEAVADAAAAASVTPDRAISGVRAELRAVYAAQASESECSSVDRERSRRRCGGARQTRQGDQLCACAEQRAACAAQASEREREQLRSRA